MDAPVAAPATLDLDADVAARSLALVVARGPLPARPHGSAGANDPALASCIESRIPNIAVLGHGSAHWLRRNGTLHDVSGAAGDRALPTAEIIYRHLDIVDDLAPEYVVIHVDSVGFRVDHGALLDAHVARRRGATVACVAMPAERARAFGVVGLGPGDRIVRYVEKPGQPQGLPGDASTSLVSTGVVAFDRHLLIDSLTVDANDRWSTHDMGHDLLPLLIRAGGVAAYVLPARAVPR